MINRSFTPLLVSKYQVDPVIDVIRNIRAFQSFSHGGNKLVGIAFAPFGQFDIINSQLILGVAVVIIVNVDEHFWESVNLWDELSNVGGGIGRVSP
jgi:hypothetical protein